MLHSAPHGHDAPCAARCQCRAPRMEVARPASLLPARPSLPIGLDANLQQIVLCGGIRKVRGGAQNGLESLDRV